MFKKVLAGASSLALAVGVIALTSLVGPVSAASAIGAGHSVAASGETCVEFSSDDLAGASSVTKGEISAAISSTNGGTDWSVSTSGDPLATIEVNSNGAWSARTGQTSFSGDSGMPIVGAWVCTLAPVAPPAPAAVVSTDSSSVDVSDEPAPAPTASYVLVAWKLPYWVKDDEVAWDPYQSFVAKADLPTKDLNALDSQLTTCGTSYQVDLYNDSQITSDLIAGGKLYGSGNPKEDFPNPEGWGFTYKLVHNPDCQPQDALASATVSAATCGTDGAGVATFALTSAEWANPTSPADQTVGHHDRTANALPGHQFSNGLTTLVVSYDVPAALDVTNPECLTKTPAGDPKFVDPTCNIDQPGTITPGTYTVLLADHVHYDATVNGGSSKTLVAGVANTAQPGDLVVITPIVDPGYVITPVIANEDLTHTFPTTALNCGQLITHPLVDPSAVQTQMGCFTNGTYTLSNDLSDPAALIWTINGSTSSQGTYSVSTPGVVKIHAAVSGPAYGLEQDAQTDWTFTFERPTTCGLKTLALTGSAPTGWIALGFAMLVSGLALVAMRSFRRRGAGA